MSLASAPQALHCNLSDVATIIWRKTRRVARTVYGVLGEGINEKEYWHYSELAAFLAFVDCGGDPTAYDTFDWDGNRTALLKQAHHHMLQLLRRSDQSYDKDRLPLKRRTEVVAVQQYCWDIWKQPVSGRPQRSDSNDSRYNEQPGSQNLRHEYDPDQAEQERVLLEATLMELGCVLAKALTAGDWALLEQHYFKGRSQRELATELGVTENAFNVRMHRIRERARKALDSAGPEWRDIFKAIV